MAFGKTRNTQGDDNETQVSETEGGVDLDDEVVEVEPTSASQASGNRVRGKVNAEKDPNKPLIDEVSFHGAGNSKNPGGCKQWTCTHCKGKFTSTYTRIHVHFFGAAVGKKAEIKRCPAVLGDRALFERLSKKVKEAESSGVSKCLKNSVLLKSASSSKRIEESFGIMERNIKLQSRFSESYKSGPNKKWDMNPENTYIEGSSARLEEMEWEDLENEGVNGKGKRQRVD